jgi:hypothetical protein
LDDCAFKVDDSQWSLRPQESSVALEKSKTGKLQTVGANRWIGREGNDLKGLNAGMTFLEHATERRQFLSMAGGLLRAPSGNLACPVALF